MNEPKFEFYVLNYDHNRHKVINFNIFDNCRVYADTLKEVKRYCRSPKNYKYNYFSIRGDKVITGFEGLCEAIKMSLRQEWSRCEYEIIVDGLFSRSRPKENETKDEKIKRLEKDLNSGEKWDCFSQAIPNIEIITRECIRAYREWAKENRK